MSTASASGLDRPILVTGATGKQGGAVARRLLAGGQRVRALVRDPAAPAAVTLAGAGAQLVRGDFDDPATLRPALDGVRAVFGMPPVVFGPGAAPELESTRGRALIDAAVAAGIDQVVFSTVGSLGAARSAATPRNRFMAKTVIEQYLRDQVARPTVLRPVRFMTNFLGTGMFGLDGIADGVNRHVFPPDQPLQIIALEDVAEFAALAFADPARFAGRTLELAGDEPTPVEAAATISRATGLRVRYQQLTAGEAAGLGPLIAQARERAQSGDRWHADIEALRVIHPGLRSLTDWLAESGAAKLRDLFAAA